MSLVFDTRIGWHTLSGGGSYFFDTGCPLAWLCDLWNGGLDDVGLFRLDGRLDPGWKHALAFIYTYRTHGSSHAGNRDLIDGFYHLYEFQI